MTTLNNEVLVFRNDVIIENTVDKWMLEVVDQMQKSNRYTIKKAILDLGNSPCSSARCEWLDKFPGSVCLTAENVWWTVEVEHTFSEMQQGNKFRMKHYLSQLNNKINEIIMILYKNVLPESKRNKYSSILISDVYHRDVVETLITNNVTFKQSFEWDSVLKSYWIKNKDNLYIGQCSGVFNYGYEYMGSNKNIVVTPLTNRIFLTLTQALTMCLGGAINGSTGTGKTKTTLALAKTLGNLCKIINCSDRLDHEIFSHFLNGICQSKIWGLFTKFNRITRKTLSVISTLLFSMKWALLENKSEFNCRENDINLNPKVGIFITMNIEEVNGEKREIDEIIKDHFRPVICIIPDFEQICFTVLYSEGFLEAKVLSKKISLLYKLCREGLSKPLNYAFDLRSLKSAIDTAKNLVIKQPELNEYGVILKTLRDLILPKLIDEDIPLFLSFVSDLFPNIEHGKTTNSDFKLAVEIVLKREKFMKIDSQIEKIDQIREALANRNAVAIVGPTSGGKSVIINALCETLNELKTSTKLISLNPKAFTKLELYGYSDPITKTWNEGLLTNIFRKINQPIVPNSHSNHFILFDGDIDSIWIDDLNPVMDDNRMLTLGNGEKIRIKPLCNLLFEVGHLTYLVPSTVSRMGIIYVDPNNLSYNPFWIRWLEPRNLMEQTALDHCFKKYVPALLDLMFENKDGTTRKSVPLKTSVQQTKVNMINQLCFILDAILPLVLSDSPHAVKTNKLKRTSAAPVTGNGAAIPLNSMISFVTGVGVIEAVFVQALYLSLGALLTETTSRQAFDETVKELSGFERVRQNAMLGQPKKQNLKYIPCDEPTLYDYFLDFHNLEWTSWRNSVPEYVHDHAVKFNDILVPTVDSIRLTWILKLINEVKRPTIIVGELSSGKTATIKHFLKNLEPQLYIKMAINFSARTSSLDVQNNLETNLEIHSRKMYGPPAGKRLVYFIDDLNLPQIDECGTQRPIALLRGIFDKQGMYGRLGCFDWKDLVNVCFFAAMSHSGGGRNELDPRFLSLCSVFSMPCPSDDTVRCIFSSVLSGHTALFSDHVKFAVHTVVDMTIRLHKLVLKKLHLTPDKFIYVFNLCQISSIVNGMTRISPDIFTSTESFVRVWRNEFTRVICDRLIYQQDRELIERQLTQELKTHFPMQIEYALRDPLLFGDCRNAINANNQKRMYEDLIDYDSVFYLFQEVLLEYKNHHGSLDMVLFNNALDHLIRIHRTLRIERGHVVLIGPSGIGKKSLSKLAAFTSGYEVFINTSLGSNHGFKTNDQKFINDLKIIFTKVGIKNQPVIFIIDQVDAIEEGNLDHINNILTNGFVPSLYSDKKQNLEIVKNFKNEHKHLSDEMTTDIYWDMFLKNCLNNLHTVLLMSPGNNLRQIFRSYPSFLKHTYIDWIHQWPIEALNAVAEKVLIDDQVIPGDYSNDVIEQCVYMHTSVEGYVKKFFNDTSRKICFSFKHFVNCIHLYKDLIENKSNLSLMKCQHFQKGLEKINESAQELCKINERILQQDSSIKKNDEMLQILETDINRTRILVEKTVAMVNNSHEELTFKNEQIKNTREQMNKLIDKTLPVLSITKTLLNEINLEEITELIKSLETPSESAITLLECMAILKGHKDMSTWKNLCDMVEDPDFLKNLQELDVNKINQRHQTQLRTKIKFLKKTIAIQNTSKVENNIFNFIESILNYCSMYQDVIPFKNKLEKFDKDYVDASLKLQEYEDSLKSTRCTLSNLEKKLYNVSQENVDLKKENGLLRNTFEYADKLMNGLRSVHERWTDSLKNHETTKYQMIGNSLLAASFLIYAGPFSFQYRKKLIFDDWYNHIINRKIPIDLNFKLDIQLIDEKEIYNWNLNGLPFDENSIQNGILMTQSTQFALCIDPHQQVFNWIRNLEKENSLKILSFADTDYFVHFERAIQYGQSVIFIDFENMDVDIKYLLNTNARLKAIDSNYIEIEDQKCKYHKDFRLYLMTKQTNPKITTSIYSNMNVINCSITQQGLEDQLLNLLVKYEVKKLECEKELTVKKIYQNRETLKKLKNSFLTDIVNSTEPLINNTRLLNKLEDVKSKIHSSSTELKSSIQSMSDIDQSRNVYKSVSKKSALFYMALDGLKIIDPLYQFSIDSFAKLFLNSIELAKKDHIVSDRKSNIINQFTKDILEFSFINTYEKHNVLFLFQIACALEKDAGNLLDSELIFFIKGHTSYEKNFTKNTTTWLSNKSWQQVVYLSTNFERFSNLIEHIRSNTENWKEWYYSKHPESADTAPIQLNNRFDILMLIRCFRIDRVYCAVENYVCQTVGVRSEIYVRKKNTDLEFVHKKFSHLTPCTLILNNSSHSIKELTNFADKNDTTGPAFKVLSLGTCEDETIYSVLQSATQRGNWLMVQNGNFSVSILCKIEYLLEQANERWHPNFRLWLVLNEDQLIKKSLPVSLLLRSFKVIVEPSNHMKISMQSVWEKHESADLENKDAHPFFKSLLYASLFLHGILSERKKYDKVGWSLPYSFDCSEYAMCQQIITIYLAKHSKDEVPWTTIKYLIGVIVYGGKVIDSYDRRVLLTYVDEYFGDFIHSSYQPFSFYNRKDGFAPPKYIETERKLLGSDERLKSLREIIDSIPLSVDPEVCGLNANVLFGYHTDLVNTLLADMTKLCPRVDAVYDRYPDWNEVVKNTAEDISKSLPVPFDIHKVKTFYGDKCSSPNIIVLLRELEQFNTLLVAMRSTLSQLAKVFLGKVEMDSTLEEVSSSLYAGRVPMCWGKLSPQTVKSLAHFVKHVLKRTLQYSTWSQIREPLVMWLSGLHSPKSYLTSLIQSACRKYGWSMEHCTFYTVVTRWTCESEVQREPESGCYVTGLYLEGARWNVDGQCLAESRNKREKLPILAIIPVEICRLKQPKSSIAVPVYETSSKRELTGGNGCVFEVALNTSAHESIWILRGVCVVMNSE